MLIALLILNAVLLSLGVVLLRSNLRRLKQQAHDIAPLLALAPPPAADVRGLLGETTPRLISIEIQNPMQLAAQHQAVAGMLGNLAPGLVRREVYRQAAAIIRGELEKWNVAAEVRVHSVR
ncbi:MAG: hypothetical protein ABF296_04510 [Oceanococcaceae bacterium]